MSINNINSVLSHSGQADNSSPSITETQKLFHELKMNDEPDNKKRHHKRLSNYFGKKIFVAQDGAQIEMSVINVPTYSAPVLVGLSEAENINRSKMKYDLALWILEHGGLKDKNKYLMPIRLLQDAVQMTQHPEAAKKLTNRVKKA